MKPVAGLIALIALAFALAFAYRAGDGFADVMRSNARNTEANQAQEREFRQAEHKQQMNEWHQTEAARVAAWQLVWSGLSIAVVIGGGFVVLASSLAGGILVIGRSIAQVKADNLAAPHIPLDPITRQYPLLPYKHNDKLLVFNPNNGQLLDLDGTHEPVPMMIAGSSATQLAGAIAEKAAVAKDGASVASIRPPLLVDGYGIPIEK